MYFLDLLHSLSKAHLKYVHTCKYSKVSNTLNNNNNNNCKSYSNQSQQLVGSASANLSDVDSTLANYSTELQVIDREARKIICENSTGKYPLSLMAVMYLAREKEGGI